MDTHSDGSSSAAQSAPRPVDFTETALEQPQERLFEHARPGFFSRIFGRSRDAVAKEAQIDLSEPAQTAALPPASGLLNLRRLRLYDVAIPRAEIVAVAQDISLDHLVQVFRESGLTRLPVFNGTLDTPVGMAHLKDVALTAGFNGESEAFDLTTLLRPLIYAPPSMPTGVLLQKMQTDRIHMALMIDEYGGVDGLVTIEDLIEQVIGEIEDEHDQEEDKFWRQESAGCYLALARAPLEEFEAEAGLSLTDALDDEEVDTLGGVVFVLTGRVPARGEVVPHPTGVEFEIVDADPRRIKRLRVRLPKAA